MAGWYAGRMLNRSAKAMIVLVVLALVLIAAVPVAFLIGVILMLLGHVIAGLALFGGSVLAAAAVVGLASMVGVRQIRHLRALLVQDRHVVRLNHDDYTHLS